MVFLLCLRQVPLPFREVPLKNMQLICTHRKGEAQAQMLLLLSESQQDSLVLLCTTDPGWQMELMQVGEAGHACFLWIFQKEQEPQQD